MKLLLEMLSSLFYPSHKVFRLFHLHLFLHLLAYPRIHRLHCQDLHIHLLILFFSCGAFFQRYQYYWMGLRCNRTLQMGSNLPHHKCRPIYQHLLPCLHYRIVHKYLQSFDLHIARTFLFLQLVR